MSPNETNAHASDSQLDERIQRRVREEMERFVKLQVRYYAKLFGYANLTAVVSGIVYILFILPGHVASQASLQMSAVQELVNKLAENSAKSVGEAQDKITIIEQNIATITGDAEVASNDLKGTKAKLVALATEVEKEVPVLKRMLDSLKGEADAARNTLAGIEESTQIQRIQELLILLKKEDPVVLNRLTELSTSINASTTGFHMSDEEIRATIVSNRKEIYADLSKLVAPEELPRDEFGDAYPGDQKMMWQRIRRAALGAGYQCALPTGESGEGVYGVTYLFDQSVLEKARTVAGQ
jgi:hypothetical protein